MGIVIKVEVTRDVGRPRVAMHRKCHLFSLHVAIIIIILLTMMTKMRRKQLLLNQFSVIRDQ